MSGHNKILVTLKSGVRIYGTQTSTFKGKEFSAFKGIPYAEPPIGSLRFKPTVSKRWITSVFDAINEVESIQYDLTTKKLVGQEDCLVLNVYTRQKMEDKKPVIVFIHGGSFNRGSGIMFGPKKLLDQDIVLVTINYRLHIFGFLSTMDEASPGNYGLLDQIESLKWVQDNIESFGGDPNCVTVIGQSAGACSLMHLMLSPLAKGLFHRAVLMSGNSICHWSLKSNPKYWAIKVASAAGCTSLNSFEIVEYLRQMPADKLTLIQTQFWKDVMSPMAPVVDGYVLPQHPQMLIEKGLINKIPTLIGVTKDEGLLFIPLIDKNVVKINSPESIKFITAYALFVEKKFLTNQTVQLVKDEYFKNIDSTDQEAINKASIDIFTDAGLFANHYKTVNLLINAGIEPFVYSNDYEFECSVANHEYLKGTCHGDDLYFLFDCPKFFPFYHKSNVNNDTHNNFLNIWTEFARRGVPFHDKINWKPATLGNINVYHLNEMVTSNVIEYKNWFRKVDFWKKKIPPTIMAEGNLPKAML